MLFPIQKCYQLEQELAIIEEPDESLMLSSKPSITSLFDEE